MITLKSQREIEAMDRAGDFLASIHIGLRDLIKPGLDLWEVEEYVRRRCKEANVLPLQIGVEGSLMDYPYATCCGLNDEVNPTPITNRLAPSTQSLLTRQAIGKGIFAPKPDFLTQSGWSRITRFAAIRGFK